MENFSTSWIRIRRIWEHLAMIILTLPSSNYWELFDRYPEFHQLPRSNYSVYTIPSNFNGHTKYNLCDYGERKLYRPMDHTHDEFWLIFSRKIASVSKCTHYRTWEIRIEWTKLLFDGCFVTIAVGISDDSLYSW